MYSGVIEEVAHLRVGVEIVVVGPSHVSEVAVVFTHIALGEGQEDDRAFRNDGVHHQARKDDDEDRHECKAEVTFVSADVSVRVLQEEPELRRNTILVGFVFKLLSSLLSVHTSIDNKRSFKFSCAVFFVVSIGVLRLINRIKHIWF